MSKEIINFLNPIKENDLNTQVNLLFRAMKELRNAPGKIANIDSKEITIIERNYVCSIIYQLGKYSNSPWFPFSDSILIGGDINKYIEAHEKEIRSTGVDLEFSFDGDKFMVIPDLIIHGNHNPNSRNGKDQFVAVEVKSASYLGIVPFEKDFFKLNTYLTRLNYQNAIYIIINSNKDIVNQRIKQYIDNNYFVISERLNDLYFIIQESIEAEPIAYIIDHSKYDEERKKATKD